MQTSFRMHRNRAGRSTSGKTRDESILEWLPQVRVIARSELRRLGGLPALLAIDLDDLVQTGVLGLIAAIDCFDPALSAPKTYFERRIRWAILDFLRSFPYFKNDSALKREDEELLSFQPVTCEEIRRLEARVDLERLLGLLPDQQRQVILAMMHGVAQHSIAAMLKITAGRVSQIKSESFAELRFRLVAGRVDGIRPSRPGGSNRLARSHIRQRSVRQLRPSGLPPSSHSTSLRPLQKAKYGHQQTHRDNREDKPSLVMKPAGEEARVHVRR